MGETGTLVKDGQDLVETTEMPMFRWMKGTKGIEKIRANKQEQVHIMVSISEKMKRF